MIPVNDRVIVKVDMAQKNAMMIGDVKVLTATKYETNFREKSPVIAEVVDGNSSLKPGSYLLCHHNHFYTPSPYYLQDDLYSIPATHTIFAILRPSGELSPVYGNVLAGKVEIETSIPVPPEYRKFHLDRGQILDGGWTKYRPGDLVFTRPSAIYEIVYIWGDTEKRICKINSEMICAVVNPSKKK
jgi:hypothetical protein